jgi:hypothetical protein
LVALVIRAEPARTAPAANGVDLVDEDDRRGALAGVGSRWADHQHTLRADRAGPVVAGRMPQKVHYFHDLGLGALVAGDVREARVRPVLVVDLGLRLAEAHDPPNRPSCLLLRRLIQTKSPTMSGVLGW